MVEQRQRTRATDADETDEGCAHYWLIQTPAGETSEGRCKFCGATRSFFNSQQRPAMTRSAKPQTVHDAS